MKSIVQFLWQRKFKVLSYAFIAYFSYLMVLITLQYIPINFDVAFLRIKQKEIAFLPYQIAFFIHVYTSIFVLLLGLIQFSKTLRIKFTKLHRTIGKTYIVLILGLAAPSGLFMGYFANGGVISKIGFMSLAILWFFFTYKAFLFARNRHFEKHQIFMMRSFALTLSAVSLRLLKWGIVSIWELPPMDTTRIIAWGGWILNLLILEAYLFQTRSDRY